MCTRDDKGRFVNFEDKIIGDVYGDFEVKNFEYKDKNHNKFYKVRCRVCGKESLKSASKLRNNISGIHHSNKHCGIWIREYDKNIGLTINDYTIIDFATTSKDGNRYMAKCNICGTTFNTLISNFKKEFGTHHSSCTHHLPKDKYINRFRKIYSCMRYRTTNPNYNEFHLYGGRGIKSDYFEDFIVFYNEMFDSYKSHVDIYGEHDTSLDRIDFNGNYETSNCRWATNVEQGNNTRKSKYIEVNGESHTISEWCRILNLNYGTVSSRINIYNWDIKRALGME